MCYNVDPGDILDLSFFAKNGSPTSAFETRIEFLDSNGFQINQFANNFAPTLTSDYAEYTLSDGATEGARTAPGNAATARVVFAVQSFTGVNTQDVFVDDVSLSQISAVPLPAPLLMLGSILIGGFGVARVRHGRRKAA